MITRRRKTVGYARGERNYGASRVVLLAGGPFCRARASRHVRRRWIRGARTILCLWLFDYGKKKKKKKTPATSFRRRIHDRVIIIRVRHRRVLFFFYPPCKRSYYC